MKTVICILLALGEIFGACLLAAGVIGFICLGIHLCFPSGIQITMPLGQFAGFSALWFFLGIIVVLPHLFTDKDAI